MINFIKGEFTFFKFLILIIFVCFLSSILVTIYGGKLKDEIAEKTCTVFGSEYEKGEKFGEGKCIVE